MFPESWEKQQKSTVINANYSIKPILQTLCLSGKSGHEQAAETTEAGPGSPLFSPSRMGLWVVWTAVPLGLQSPVSFLGTLFFQFLMFSFLQVFES